MTNIGSRRLYKLDIIASTSLGVERNIATDVVRKYLSPRNPTFVGRQAMINGLVKPNRRSLNDCDMTKSRFQKQTNFVESSSS